MALVSVHKWLGLLWDSGLNFAKHASSALSAQSCKVSVLAGLVSAGLLPLPVAALLFECKVEGSLRFGRWLWGIEPTAREAFDSYLASWAKSLLGSDHWRSSDVALAELGWFLSGSGRCVLDVAAKLALLCTMNRDSLVGDFFAEVRSYQASWASRASRLIEQWGLLDWQTWSQHQGQPATLKSYKTYCLEVLQTKCVQEWSLRVAIHRAPIPYPVIMEPPVSLLKNGLPWNDLLHYRCLCRFRAGLLCWGHNDYKHSQANVLHCIACDKRYSKSTIWYHVLQACELFNHPRTCLEDILGRKIDASDVWMTSDAAGFKCLLDLSLSWCSWEHQFWQSLRSL